MTHTIRVLEAEDELIKAANVFRAAMIGLPQLSDLQSGQIGKLLEHGRTLGAFVDGQLVGTTDAATSRLALPGGRIVSHAAVTHVGVLPSYTRRGIATDLLERQLRDIHDRGEVVASLRASEATIYERYGYAVASSSNTVEVNTAHADLRPGVQFGGPVRLVEPTTAWDLLPRIYADNRPTRPGSIDRPAVWWQTQQLRADTSSGPSYVAVAGELGSENGFARYHPVNTDRWFVDDQRTVVVDDFFAPTIQSYLGLVRFLLGLDLVDRVVFSMLPQDDPLPWLLVDRRAARVTASRDETWLRVVDAGAALAGRSYAGDGTLTIHVKDALLQDNTRTFAISAQGAEPTNTDPHLEVGITALAAALLGATQWRVLALAGLVTVNDSAAIALADQLFQVPQSPHAGFFF